MPKSNRIEVPDDATSESHPDEAAARAHTRRLFKAVAIALVVMLTVGLGWSLYQYQRIVSRVAPVDPTVLSATRQELDSTKTLPKEDPLYVLLLGTDRRPGEDVGRSDTMLVLRLDPASKRVSMLSIPRDTRVSIPGHGLDKITHANAFGGPALAVKTVRQYTGLPIHHYLEIDFVGFADVVDRMDGIWIDVDQAIKNNDTGRVELSRGYQELSGQQALSFVRSRHFPDGDFTRVEHQRRFLSALIKQALEPRQLTRFPGIATAVAEHIETDMSVSELVRLASRYRGLSDDDVNGYTAPGTPGSLRGVSYVFPDLKASRALFETFQRGQEPTRTP
jgi:LCP family protein required for cell wall assembly